MLLSIITINLNNEEGLRRTFKSVFCQSEKNFEYIIIDGASTDGSIKLIEENQSKINYWISEKDNGIYQAMNKGIAKAKGNYLLFLNSGDSFSSTDSLEQAVRQSKMQQADIFYADANYIDTIEKRAWQKNYPDSLDTHFLLISSICHQATFIRQELFEQIGKYREEYRLSADWMFYFDALKKGFIFKKLLGVTLSNFYLHGFSSNYRLSNQERRDFFQKNYPELLSKHDFITRKKNIPQRIWIKITDLKDLVKHAEQRRKYNELVEKN